MYSIKIRFIPYRKGVLFATLLFFIIGSAANNTDTLYIEKYKQFRSYNSDTIFSNYATKGFIASIDDIYEYYEDIFPYLSEEKKSDEISKMIKTAKLANNKALLFEAEFIKAICLSEETEAEFQNKIDRLEQVIKQAEKLNNISLQLRGMESIFDLYWKQDKYVKAFHQLHFIDKVLQNVSANECPDKWRLYYRMGEAYYFFKDYNKAIPYLRKAIKPSKYYYDTSNLQAINRLGHYHIIQGSIDSAEYYFRSAYNSYDVVKSKSTYDALALSNLGHTFFKREKYDEAIAYFEAGFSHLTKTQKYELAIDPALALAECYLNKNNLLKTKEMISSCLFCLENSDYVDIHHRLYPLMCKYYAKVGNVKQTTIYLDSAIVSNNRYIHRYNALNILHAEQKLFDAESKVKDEEIRYKEENYRNQLFSVIIVLCIISFALILLSFLYRKNRKAYQALVLKNQDWAEIKTINDSVNIASDEIVSEPTEEDLEMVQQVNELIKKEKIFKDIDLTLDSLSKQLNINRNYLSKAINKTTGKNFNVYINEYRIKEAIKIMSDKKSDLISIDAIALEVGFGNRTSFYQSFKKITGLSPSDFRNNKNYL